ncbi:MAG: hypothetical protein P8R42_17655 [Candidatus Binatia bacterium]|nr:hypothetical protein [Candidatus Binatia bacterium]
MKLVYAPRMLLLAVALDGRRWRPTPMQRVVGAVVFVSVFLAAVIAALATWTPAEHDWAAGVHGRYFLSGFPALAIAILPPLRSLNGRGSPVPWIFLVAGVVAANALVLVAFARQYDWSGFVLWS